MISNVVVCVEESILGSLIQIIHVHVLDMKLQEFKLRIKTEKQRNCKPLS